MPIVGGHSIDDPEPKYGMAVTGVVHPRAVVRNSTGRAGDVLFLTKPIGGGAITTGAKRGMADDAVVRRCTAVMTTLNAAAARAATTVGASAMTDVTGFGLLGHLHELALASGVAARVEAGAVPAIDGRAGAARRPGRWPAAAAATASGSRRTCSFAEPVPEAAGAHAVRRDDVRRAAGRNSGGARRRDGSGADGGAPASARIGTLQQGPPGVSPLLRRSWTPQTGIEGCLHCGD